MINTVRKWLRISDVDYGDATAIIWREGKYEGILRMKWIHDILWCPIMQTQRNHDYQKHNVDRQNPLSMPIGHSNWGSSGGIMNAMSFLNNFCVFFSLDKS